MAGRQHNASKFSFMKAELDDPHAWALPSKVSTGVTANGDSVSLGGQGRWLHAPATGSLMQDRGQVSQQLSHSSPPYVRHASRKTIPSQRSSTNIDHSEFSKPGFNRKGLVKKLEDDADIDENINQYERIILQELEANSRGGSSGGGSDNLVLSLVKGLEEEMRKVDEVLNSKTKYESGGFNSKQTIVPDYDVKNGKKHSERLDCRHDGYAPQRQSRLTNEQSLVTGDASLAKTSSVGRRYLEATRSSVNLKDPHGVPNNSHGNALHEDSHLSQPTQSVPQELSREQISQSWGKNRKSRHSQYHSTRNPVSQPTIGQVKQVNGQPLSQSWNGMDNLKRVHLVDKYDNEASADRDLVVAMKELPKLTRGQHQSAAELEILRTSLAAEKQKTYGSQALSTVAAVRSYEKSLALESRGRWDQVGDEQFPTSHSHRSLSPERPWSSVPQPHQSNGLKSTLKKHTAIYPRLAPQGRKHNCPVKYGSDPDLSKYGHGSEPQRTELNVGMDGGPRTRSRTNYSHDKVDQFDMGPDVYEGAQLVPNFPREHKVKKSYQNDDQKGDILLKGRNDTDYLSSKPPLPRDQVRHHAAEPLPEKWNRSWDNSFVNLAHRPPSDSSEHSSRIDPQTYQSYAAGILHSTRKSEQFLRLQKHYATLERIAEIEEKTNMTNLMHGRDRFNMLDLRSKSLGNLAPQSQSDNILLAKYNMESMWELKELYADLDEAQEEDEFFYDNKHLDDVQWNPWHDFGLKQKELTTQDLQALYESGLNRNTQSRRHRHRKDQATFRRQLSFKKLYQKYRHFDDRSRRQKMLEEYWQHDHHSHHRRHSETSSVNSVCSNMDNSYIKIMESAAEKARERPMYGYYINEGTSPYETHVEKLKKLSKSCPDISKTSSKSATPTKDKWWEEAYRAAHPPGVSHGKYIKDESGAFGPRPVDKTKGTAQISAKTRPWRKQSDTISPSGKSSESGYDSFENILTRNHQRHIRQKLEALDISGKPQNSNGKYKVASASLTQQPNRYPGHSESGRRSEMPRIGPESDNVSSLSKAAPAAAAAAAAEAAAAAWRYERQSLHAREPPEASHQPSQNDMQPMGKRHKWLEQDLAGLQVAFKKVPGRRGERVQNSRKREFWRKNSKPNAGHVSSALALFTGLEKNQNAATFLEPTLITAPPSQETVPWKAYQSPASSFSAERTQDKNHLDPAPHAGYSNTSKAHSRMDQFQSNSQFGALCKKEAVSMGPIECDKKHLGPHSHDPGQFELARKTIQCLGSAEGSKHADKREFPASARAEKKKIAQNAKVFPQLYESGRAPLDTEKNYPAEENAPQPRSSPVLMPHASGSGIMNPDRQGSEQLIVRHSPVSGMPGSTQPTSHLNKPRSTGTGKESQIDVAIKGPTAGSHSDASTTPVQSASRGQQDFHGDKQSGTKKEFYTGMHLKGIASPRVTHSEGRSDDAVGSSITRAARGSKGGPTLRNTSTMDTDSQHAMQMSMPFEEAKQHFQNLEKHLGEEESTSGVLGIDPVVHIPILPRVLPVLGTGTAAVDCSKTGEEKGHVPCRSSSISALTSEELSYDGHCGNLGKWSGFTDHLNKHSQEGSGSLHQWQMTELPVPRSGSADTFILHDSLPGSPLAYPSVKHMKHRQDGRKLEKSKSEPDLQAQLHTSVPQPAQSEKSFNHIEEPTLKFAELRDAFESVSSPMLPSSKALNENASTENSFHTITSRNFSQNVNDPSEKYSKQRRGPELTTIGLTLGRGPEHTAIHVHPTPGRGPEHTAIHVGPTPGRGPEHTAIHVGPTPGRGPEHTAIHVGPILGRGPDRRSVPNFTSQGTASRAKSQPTAPATRLSKNQPHKRSWDIIRAETPEQGPQDFIHNIETIGVEWEHDKKKKKYVVGEYQNSPNRGLHDQLDSDCVVRPLPQYKPPPEYHTNVYPLPSQHPSASYQSGGASSAAATAGLPPNTYRQPQSGHHQAQPTEQSTPTQPYSVKAYSHTHPHTQRDTKTHPNTQHDIKTHPNTQHDTKNYPNTQRDIKTHPNTQHDTKNYPNTQRDIKNYPNTQHDIKNYPITQHDIKYYPNTQRDIKNYPNTQHDIKNYPNTQHDIKNYPNTQQDTKNYPNTHHHTKDYPNIKHDSKTYPKTPNDTKVSHNTPHDTIPSSRTESLLLDASRQLPYTDGSVHLHQQYPYTPKPIQPPTQPHLLNHPPTHLQSNQPTHSSADKGFQKLAYGTRPAGLGEARTSIEKKQINGMPPTKLNYPSPTSTLVSSIQTTYQQAYMVPPGIPQTSYQIMPRTESQIMLMTSSGQISPSSKYLSEHLPRMSAQQRQPALQAVQHSINSSAHGSSHHQHQYPATTNNADVQRPGGGGGDSGVDEPGQRHSIPGSSRSPISTWDQRRRRDAEAAKRKEYLQLITAEEKAKRMGEELRMMESRKHSDIFSPAKKSAIPNNRFEEGADTASLQRPKKKGTTVIRGKAQALYSFTAQNSRELTFKRGDSIYLLRQIDKNWYEGEHHGRVGIFPVNYVEVTTSLDEARAASFLREGHAKARYNFSPQTNIELPLKKGDTVQLIRRIDNNWYEGRVGPRQGIFPVAYVDIFKEPDTPMMTPVPSLATTPATGSPGPMSPVSSISNGPAPTIPSAPNSPNSSLDCFDFSHFSVGGGSSLSPGQRLGMPASMYSRDYIPESQMQRASSSLSTSGYNTLDTTRGISRSALSHDRPSSAGPSLSGDMQRQTRDSGFYESKPTKYDQHKTELNLQSAYGAKEQGLRPSTSTEASVTRNSQQQHKPSHQQHQASSATDKDQLRYPPYRAVYNYIPLNADELELREGDIVFVMETCDDGWLVGTSQRTKDFGTFPGNYVRRA